MRPCACLCVLIRACACTCVHERACICACVRACLCLCFSRARVRRIVWARFLVTASATLARAVALTADRLRRWTARMSARICRRSLRCLPAGTARTSATTCSSSPRTSRCVVRSLPGESAPRTAPALHCTPLHSTALHSAVTTTPALPNCASVLLYRVGLCACVRRSSCGGTSAEAAVCGRGGGGGGVADGVRLLAGEGPPCDPDVAATP